MTTWRIEDASSPILPQATRESVVWTRRARRRRRRLQFVGACLLFVDAAGLLAAATLSSHSAPAGLALSALAVLALYGAGAYRVRLTLLVLDDLPRLLSGLALAGVAMASFSIAVGQNGQVSTVAVGTLLAIAFVTFGRTATYAAIRWGRSQGLLASRTVILGAGDIGATLGNAVREHPEYGLQLVGFADDGPRISDSLAAPLLGSATELATLVDRHEIDIVLIAFGSAHEDELVAPLRTCAAAGCQIFVVPRLSALGVAGPVDQVRATPLVPLRAPTTDAVAWRAKRILDVELAGLALVLLSPLLLVTAVAVRIESGPGVLFRQQRIGVGGQEFTLYKFRSLTPVDDDESQTRWTVADDDRMGPVGRVIRKTSIDELPQLFNVLRGEMSLVGPRPERPYFVAEFSRTVTSYADRHRVPCGVTGLAAVKGLRGDTSIDERARFDNFYIDNWSPWLDLKILLWTIPAVLRGHDG
ncbi:MAG TPA: exopolysaccharide biosynthesis polyprenyl glycosylphosphotransferase [Jiangellaceae bacterium]